MGNTQIMNMNESVHHRTVRTCRPFRSLTTARTRDANAANSARNSGYSNSWEATQSIPDIHEEIGKGGTHKRVRRANPTRVVCC